MVTVAVSGLHGTGKTTASKALAKRFDLRYVSAGEVFREMARERGMSLKRFSDYVEEHPEIDEKIDDRTAREAEKDNVLIDARLAGWMAEGADLRILLTSGLEERVQRISKRECRPYEEVKRETIAREKSEKKRYSEHYGIDVDDHSVFDLILDTGKFNEEEMIKILEHAIKLVSN
ncbi:hypothetical protein AKJ51_04760 [candidate division MSBL1 archaeon SCGC-AAA382A20]|uniref:Cytidylate kinase n=1 Tax=candidate division MSBL1 archaeon SCGC-AAA382A20 TaxID=1698280 RepID=A0A133VH80_9EURY|nr:hypothetical protein AKJ51_04760 [candidate division MSBL1 archaeon SCGC-AAA382A20]